MREQNYEMTGVIKVIGDVQTFPSGFSKREVVITTPGDHPQDVMFEALKDKGDLLEKFSEGDEVAISFNIGGREYNGRYFNSLKLWKIKATQERATTRTSAPTGEPLREAPKQAQDDDDSSALPF